MRKRYYILFVARGAEGELRKIPIPLHYLYVFLAGALIGMFSITGMAGSYGRMLLKVARFNQLRSEKDALSKRYNKLEQVAQEKEQQAASLSSLADEVSTLYGLKAEPFLATPERLRNDQYRASFDQLYALKTTAMTGAATIGIGLGPTGNTTTADWQRASAAPTLWPVDGRITGSFGERVDPFRGEGAFHSGVDISTSYGRAVLAPADGVVTFADIMGGYGRVVIVQHAHGISTRYGHLAGFAVTPGQAIRRGDMLGYVGLSGRSTGPHLHYEVRINDIPVNPYKYLRSTFAQMPIFSAGTD